MHKRQTELQFFYQRVVNVWENFCILHKDMYDLTCEEYLTLLESDIDKLETLLPIKEEIIRKISAIETQRSELIAELNQNQYFSSEVTKASELLKAFSPLDQQAPLPALKNLNDLLIDIIQKIQEQNKKNQLFLNKAMLSLRDIKQGFTGKKAFTTYGADGMARANK